MGKKIIVPICGIDDSMEDFSLNGWRIKKLLSTSEYHTIFNDIADNNLYNRIRGLLNETEDIFSVVSFTNDDSNPYYMVFAKETDDAEEIQSIADVLRVVKTSQFGCWHPVIFNHDYEAKVTATTYTTSALQIRPPLLLSVEEKKQIALFLQRRDNKRSQRELPLNP